jgi:hypothetical protein
MTIGEALRFHVRDDRYFERGRIDPAAERTGLVAVLISRFVASLEPDLFDSPQ